MTAHVNPVALCDIDSKVQEWAARVIALAIAVAHGEMMKADAIDELWSDAEHAGLTEIFGVDHTQSALSLAFEGRWR